MPRDKADPLWRKKKSRVSKQPPFPVPVASISGGLPSRQTWYCYTGFLKGSTVVVQHSGDVDFLYRMGFFGKGSLSRSEPNFEARRRKVNIPCPNKDKEDEESEDSSVDTIQVAVASKRNYLTHLQYRALAEDDESRYNELIEQEAMQRFRNDEEEEDYEDEEAESYESDCSSPVKMDAGAEHGSDRESGLSSDLGSQSISFLTSLLSQVAALSNESIATFIRVPETLHQLELKFQRNRLQQMSQLDHRKAIDQPSNPSPSKSISKSRSQDVIDLRDLDETDDVVVLNSDENSKDSERPTRRESENIAGKASKSWDDPDNKGDAKFWGMDSSEGAEKKIQRQGNSQGLTIESSVPDSELQSGSCKGSSSPLNFESSTNNKPESLRNGAMTDGENADKKTLDEAMVSDKNGDEKKDTGISDDFQMDVSLLKTDFKDSSVSDKQNEDCSDKIKNGAPDSQSSSAKNTSKDTGDSASVEAAKLDGGASVLEGDQKSSDPKATSSIPPSHGEDSNDSDDVICVEAGSAEPSKLHNFLSQSSLIQPQTLPFPLISKMVRFMTNIAKEPRFVTAKVGFHSWTNILHFNFSGDSTHLPTSLEVLQEEDHTPAHGLPSDDVRNIVYERIYPPVNSLVAHPDSKGVVIKQRLQGIPFLDAAKRNVLRSLSNASHQSHSDSSLVPSSHHKPSPHRHLHHKKSFLSSLQNEPAGPESSLPHQISNLFEKEEEESSSLKPSHLTQYINIFKKERTERPLDSKSINNGSGDNEADKGDECLELIHKELRELKASPLLSNQAATEKQEVTDKATKLLNFNRLLSRYLSKIGISLIKEFVLLKLLVCGSETNANISEDLVVAAKAELPSEEYSSLLERMDFVQSCLASYKSSPSVTKVSEKKANSEDVIMIDLSDEESNDKNESAHIVAASSTLPKPTQLEPQNENKSKANGDSSKDTAVCDLTEKPTTAEGSVLSEDKETPLESLGNQNKRKRSRQDSLESEQGTASKIPKVDSLHFENSKDEKDFSGKVNGSQAVNEPHISSDHQNADVTDSMALEKSEKNVNNDSQVTDKKAGGDSDTGTQKGDSIEKGDPSSSSGVEAHHISTQKIPDKGSVSPEGKSEVKSNSDVCASLDSVDKSASHSAEKSTKDNGDKNTSRASLEENQIVIESSDEEEERMSNVRGRSLKFVASQPHPYSISDDLNGNLFVVPNTSDEEEDEEDPSSTAGKFTWQSCVKKDPYPSAEVLHLLLEEAFFLTFGLGCLTVLDPEKKPMTITEMWQQFPTLKDNFVPHYVAYHYFRSKGWVPKSGLKFGCDFVLYREGPPFFHGSYSVVVVAVQEGTLTPMIGDEGGLDYAQRLNTWITLSGLNRVTEHVAKELMFCYVICPKNLTEEESKSPKCMSRFRVKEVIVSRWVSSKEREVKDKEEMP